MLAKPETAAHLAKIFWAGAGMKFFFESAWGWGCRKISYVISVPSIMFIQFSEDLSRTKCDVSELEEWESISLVIQREGLMMETQKKTKTIWVSILHLAHIKCFIEFEEINFSRSASGKILTPDYFFFVMGRPFLWLKQKKIAERSRVQGPFSIYL